MRPTNPSPLTSEVNDSSFARFRFHTKKATEISGSYRRADHVFPDKGCSGEAELRVRTTDRDSSGLRDFRWQRCCEWNSMRSISAVHSQRSITALDVQSANIFIPKHIRRYARAISNKRNYTRSPRSVGMPPKSKEICTRASSLYLRGSFHTHPNGKMCRFEATR